NNVEIANDYLSNVVLKSLPQPNWRLTYNGLSKLAPFTDMFQSISISHGYKGTLSVSSYETNLGGYDPDDPFKLITEDTPDQSSNPGLNYYTRFRVPDIQIQEQFS